MVEYTTEFAKGTIYWAKILGSPVTDYDGTGKEWQYSFVPEDPSFLKSHGLLGRLKQDSKGVIEGDFLALRSKATDAEGDPKKPIRVVDVDNMPWDDEVLIGNGSKVDVKLSVADWGKGKHKSIYTNIIRVTDLVSYEGGGDPFAEMDGAGQGEKPKKSVPVLDELDDDIPF